MQRVEFDFDGMRAELMAAPISPSSWALNELIDSRHCLVFDQGMWIAGFYEKGRFDERFSEVDSRIATTRFIEWICAAEASTSATAGATERWLRRTGQSRP